MIYESLNMQGNKTQGRLGRPNRGNTEFCDGMNSISMLFLMLIAAPRFEHKLNQLN